MRLGGCYKATVNESETITEAQPISPVRGGGAGESRTPGCGLAVAPHIERS
jgi:hypothetical protein